MRSIDDIYSEIITEKNTFTNLSSLQPAIDDTQTLLSDLTTTSKVAVWRLWAYITAVAIWIHEQMWEIFKADMVNLINNAIPGTIRWYHLQAMSFQLGDNLQWLDNKYRYLDTTSTTAVAKQIIKRAAVYESGNQLIIKVAKEVGGAPAPLSTLERTAFQAYLNKIKFAGTQLLVLSYSADELQIFLDVKYNPLIIDGTGLLIGDTTYPVNDALEEYVKNIVFAGILNKTKLIDAVQLATGVDDVILTGLVARASGGAWAAVSTQEYNSTAGYMVIDSITINYTPNV